MPKKPPRNAFYFYMQHFKEDQRKKGIHYANMAEVADAAGPVWKTAPPSVRNKFEEIAKQEKQRTNVPENKYTSLGKSFAEIEQEQREAKEAAEQEEKDIKNIIKTRAFNTRNILDLDMYLMDVNYYCKMSNGDYLIGECTLLRFNLKHGVMENYHQLINPGVIPLGYASDVKYGCEELCLPMPDESVPRTNYMQILATIIDYLKKHDKDVTTVPPIFTMPDKVAPIWNFIQQMCYKVGENDSLFRVYKLDTLFFTLTNAIKTSSNDGFPKQSLALHLLKQDNFKYTPGLGCEHHETNDKSFECSMSRVKRWAFTILDSCCQQVGIDVEAGKHVPADFDVEGIINYKMEKKGRAPPTVAGVSGYNASANTSINTSYNDAGLGTSRDSYLMAVNSSVGSAVSVKKEKKMLEPQRMPKMNYSAMIRAPPAMTETEFPALSAGRGRGRSIAKSLNNMKIGD